MDSLGTLQLLTLWCMWWVQSLSESVNFSGKGSVSVRACGLEEVLTWVLMLRGTGRVSPTHALRSLDPAPAQP